MSAAEPHEELQLVIRKLQQELEWALRIGAEYASPPTSKAPPLRAEREVEQHLSSPTPTPPPPSTPPPSASFVSSPSPSPSPSSPSPSPSPPSSPSPALPVLVGGGSSLADIRAELGDCTRCKLHTLGRTQIVFGVGNPKAELMFVGEGPGADEDRIGEPFVGAAGQLLTRVIEQGMGIKREEVYIANIVKCRPPRNRDPEPDEVESCEPFLRAQIRAVQPKVIVALGRYAAQTLLRASTPITKLRGVWTEFEGIPLMPTYHPAFLLRNPAEKRAVWNDVQAVLVKLGRPIPRAKADQ